MTTPPSGGPTSKTVIDVHYQINVTGPQDDNLFIEVKISRTNNALAHVTEYQMADFVRQYLSSLTPNPVTITRYETTRTDGL